MLEAEFKSNSTPKNRFVRWGLHPTYILWNCLISSQCETFNTKEIKGPFTTCICC